MADERKTTPDHRAKRGWGIVDAVIRLREHGTDRVYGLPDPPARCTVGTAGMISVVDPTRSVSRKHAELIPVRLSSNDSPTWSIVDLGSTNGLRRDGEAQSQFILQPGVEVTLGSLGGLRLICESANLVTLLELLRRFIGMAPERQHEVDAALRALRDWAADRTELLLIGDGNLIPVATRIHRLVIGDNASMVMYDPKDPSGSLLAAARGTLCAVMEQTKKVAKLVKAVREVPLAQRPQLMLCAPHARPKRGNVAVSVTKLLERPAVISLPSLQTRANEVELILQAFVRDIEEEFGTKPPPYSAVDWERLRAIEYKSFADIEYNARRFVTMRFLGAKEGGQRLGIDRTGLGKWAIRRKIPTST